MLYTRTGISLYDFTTIYDPSFSTANYLATGYGGGKVEQEDLEAGYEGG